jgi:hypothetical protein
MGEDKPKPKKVKISRTTGKKLRQSGQTPPGADKEGLLAKIVKALQDKNKGK